MTNNSLAHLCRGVRLGRLALLVILISTLALPAATPPAFAASLTVNSIADAADATPGDGICETATGNGICTLRAAIQEANALAGTDTISFNLSGAGVHTITPSSALPTINSRMTIDGTTQLGASCAAWPPTLQIELNGSGTTSAIGLNLLTLTDQGMPDPRFIEIVP